MKPFVITIPCFKAEKTIVETLKAIAEQDQPLELVEEIILADDCSPDNTIKAAEEFWADRIPKLKVFHQRKNCGEYINVNSLIYSLPKDVQWFLHMHGDNIPTKDWYRVLAAGCKQSGSNVGMVAASYEVFDESKTSHHGDQRAGEELILGSKEAVIGTIQKGCWWHTSCTAIRREAFIQSGGFPPGMRQKGDWDYLLRFLKTGFDVLYVQKPLMRYRQHAASASSFAFQKNLDIEESLQIILKYADLLSCGDILKYHANTALVLARRLLSSTTHKNPARAFSSAVMQVRSFGNLIACLSRL